MPELQNISGAAHERERQRIDIYRLDCEARQFLIMLGPRRNAQPRTRKINSFMRTQDAAIFYTGANFRLRYNIIDIQYDRTIIEQNGIVDGNVFTKMRIGCCDDVFCSNAFGIIYEFYFSSIL